MVLALTAGGRAWISMTCVRSWKVLPYWLVLTASSRSESVPPLSARKPPMSVSGFCWSSGGLVVLGSMLLFPSTLALKDWSRYAADHILPAASHAALVSIDLSSHTCASAVVML